MIKKIFLTLLLSIFLSSNAWAVSVTFLDLVSSGSSASCGGTQTFVGNPGDTETFEYQADDFCCTEFSVTDPDNIISTYDSTQVKNGTYAASFAFTGAGAENDNFIQANLGAGDSDFAMDFWYFPFIHSVDYATWRPFSATVDANIASSARGFMLETKHEGSNYFRLRVVGTTTVASSQYLENAWYRVEIDFNQNAASTVKIYNVSDVLQETLDFTALDYTPQYLNWGCINDDVNAESTCYFDDFRFKSGGGGF